MRFIFGVIIISCAFAFSNPNIAVQNPPQAIQAPKIETVTQEPQVKKKTRMLYFGATWCPPCNKMKQLFKDPEVKKELDRLDFRMYDEAKDKQMFKIFKITKYPTTVFQAENRGATRFTGYIPKKDLLEILRSIKD